MHRSLDALREGSFDLLILGGGITGAGVALDAALRGLRVALIDKGDFASGASSATSKLVHGGLRYLEYGHLPLVYESLRERRLLLHNAPHLVHPVRFVVPFFVGARVPPWQWRTGLTLYDLLAGAGNLRRSRPLHLSQFRREFPALNHSGLVGGAEYYDAQMDDARVCIEVLRTAAAQGACLANYVEAVVFEKVNARIAGVQVEDHVGGETFSIRARQVVNTTGPWVDAVCRLAGDASGPHLRPTKGVHLLVPDRGLRAAFLLLHPADGRVFFVLPWQGKTLIGATDTLCDDSPDAIQATREEVAYLLAGYNRFFAEPLTEADILSTFAGLRPLIRSGPAKPSSLSREFRLFASPSGLLSAAGGKFTTYRAMAEVITDAVVDRLGRRRRCRTRRYALDGTPAERWAVFVKRETSNLGERHGMEKETARHLVERYGRRAAEVAAYLERGPALGKPLVPGEPELRAEFAYQQEHEMALFPEDHLLRRTHLGMFRPELFRRVGQT
jgi:glycerol-3-phosphate dehydrogenase